MAILLLPQMGLAKAPDERFLGAWLALWGIFTLFMFISTLKGARMLQFVFGSLTLLFLLLAVAHLMHLPSLEVSAGWVGILCGASACYLAMGEVLNDTFGRTLLPIGAKSL